MKKSFEVLNIKCNGCATSVKNALRDDFGDVEVDLEKMPRVITLEIKDEESEKLLRKKLKESGYPLADEELSTLEDVGLKAKSFVSCAVGKIENFKM